MNRVLDLKWFFFIGLSLSLLVSSCYSRVMNPDDAEQNVSVQKASLAPAHIVFLDDSTAPQQKAHVSRTAKKFKVRSAKLSAKDPSNLFSLDDAEFNDNSSNSDDIENPAQDLYTRISAKLDKADAPIAKIQAQ